MHGGRRGGRDSGAKLLHGEEDTVCGDSGNTGADKREKLQDVDAGFWIAETPSKVQAMKSAHTAVPSDGSITKPACGRKWNIRSE